jgi:hypothetical protein
VSFCAPPCLAVIFPSQQNDTGEMLELWFFTGLQSWRKCFSTRSAFGASCFKLRAIQNPFGNELGSADSMEVSLNVCSTANMRP